MKIDYLCLGLGTVSLGFSIGFFIVALNFKLHTTSSIWLTMYDFMVNALVPTIYLITAIALFCYAFKGGKDETN